MFTEIFLHFTLRDVLQAIAVTTLFVAGLFALHWIFSPFLNNHDRYDQGE
jgi:hypothetical protein